MVSALPVEVAAFRQPTRRALLRSVALAPFRVFLRLSATLFWAVAKFRGQDTAGDGRRADMGRRLVPLADPEMLRELI